MKKYLSFSMTLTIVATTILQTITPTAFAADTFQLLTPENETTINSREVTFKWEDTSSTHFDIAIGSQEGLPDYGWHEIDKKELTTKLPENIDEIFVRFFAYNKDGHVYQHNYRFPVDYNATTPDPTDTDGFKLLSPPQDQIIDSSTLDLSWEDPEGTKYDVAIGSASGMPDYGWHENLQTGNLSTPMPTNTNKIFIRIFSYHRDGTVPSYDFEFSINPQTTPPPDPTPTPDPTPDPATIPEDPATPVGSLSAVWANTGEDKVAQEELRASWNKEEVKNLIWNGTRIYNFGAKNEVIAFNTILEAKTKTVENVSVQFDTLTGPNGYQIKTTSKDIFDWNNRPIEVFFVKYLEIKGLSILTYNRYNEFHIPEKFQKPHSENGLPNTKYGWEDRPDHNKNYPDIAVPIELEPTFDIQKGQNQSIWADIYIPKDAPAGLYKGTFKIKENGKVTGRIPVRIKVFNFMLPDEPSAKTMVFMGYNDIIDRYLGSNPDAHLLAKIRDLHFQIAHRHKMSLIDANWGLEPWDQDAPRPEWASRLDGSLFTPENGYDGPGVGVGNGIFSIGTYGSWDWKDEGKSGMWAHTNAWETWFKNNAPNTERFLYLIDESSDTAQINRWASWINSNPGPGSALLSMATMWLTDAFANAPELDIPASAIYVGITAQWKNAINKYINSEDKRFWYYNSGRPATGSHATEASGIDMRVLAWTQYKMKVDRWFMWESTYYNNYQGGEGQTNVFKTAQTFGDKLQVDNDYGETGWNYTNGDGVLFYPGTDKIYPEESYDVYGPFVSLRLKHWRRGIQDVNYLTLASKINPRKVSNIVSSMIPKVLWENGVDNPDDPTYANVNVSWTDDPDVWERKRKSLAAYIEKYQN